jgi:peptidoglycan/LPS O-acetylase OafA/YrhL
MRYRSDIDGLRAFAILAVVFCDLGVKPFTGGFAGADIFFVISGYLITGIVAGEIAQNRFTLLDFYERRLRRIIPALFTMLAATTALAFWLMPPAQLMDEARSLLYTVFFASNFYFGQADRYFDALPELKPLLHTWSLAIEAQFYLLFPLFLILLHRFAKGRLKFFILAIGLLSLAASVIAVMRSPITAFYGTSFRVWELMLGAGLAIGLVPQAKPGAMAQSLAFSGLVLIIFSVFTFNAATPFPGIAALAPALGAALLIHTGPARTLGTRLLSSGPLPFIGKISYSLYLWHWPIVVFYRLGADHVLDRADILDMLTLVFVAACASWFFVEKRLRVQYSVVRRNALFAGMGVVAAALLALGLGLGTTEGATARFQAYFEAPNQLANDRDLRVK